MMACDEGKGVGDSPGVDALAESSKAGVDEDGVGSTDGAFEPEPEPEPDESPLPAPTP